MNQDKPKDNDHASKTSAKILTGLSIVTAIISVLAMFFIKDEAIRYGCMAVFAVSAGLNETCEYIDCKKKSSLRVAVICFVFALIAVVFCAGTLLGIQ